MDLLGLNRIAKLLQVGVVPQFYQLLFIIFSLVFTAAFIANATGKVIIGYESVTWAIVIFILGTLGCYYLNGKGAGKDFAMRFMMFYFQCLIITIVVTFLTVIIWEFFLADLLGLRSLSLTAPERVRFASELLFFALMFWGFRKVNAKKQG